TKEGREKQAAAEERRQQERDIREALTRGEELEPPAEDEEPPRECHRRGCAEPPAFVVRERYQEETGHGAVVATAYLCRDHTDEESPTNLDNAYSGYVFRVDPVDTASDADMA
ncbi:hypothetical protein, partial [Natronomonas sp.]|uniref:hypothetical protein n=1 Tax=Natronomonas sp. TaxID=2184060 RepID=UPI002FC4C55F